MASENEFAYHSSANLNSTTNYNVFLGRVDDGFELLLEDVSVVALALFALDGVDSFAVATALLALSTTDGSG